MTSRRLNASAEEFVPRSQSTSPIDALGGMPQPSTSSHKPSRVEEMINPQPKRPAARVLTPPPRMTISPRPTSPLPPRVVQELAPASGHSFEDIGLKCVRSDLFANPIDHHSMWGPPALVKLEMRIVAGSSAVCETSQPDNVTLRVHLSAGVDAVSGVRILAHIITLANAQGGKMSVVWDIEAGALPADRSLPLWRIIEMVDTEIRDPRSPMPRRASGHGCGNTPT